MEEILVLELLGSLVILLLDECGFRDLEKWNELKFNLSFLV